MEEKKICFDSCFKKHADFKVCLHYDEVKSREFFNFILDLYIEKDARILSIVDDLKKRKNISNNKRKKAKKNEKEMKKINNQFRLNNAEIENIFDIIEREALDL